MWICAVGLAMSKPSAGFANQRAAKADASVDTACPGAMLGPSPSLT